MSETDAQQFDRRYKNVTEAIDKFRDALLNAGPSLDEHKQALHQINAASPLFFMGACYALASYSNNQEDVASEETVDAFVALLQENEEARERAFEVGADVLGGAINDLGVALRLTGKINWEDKTPDTNV